MIDFILACRKLTFTFHRDSQTLTTRIHAAGFYMAGALHAS